MTKKELAKKVEKLETKICSLEFSIKNFNKSLNSLVGYFGLVESEEKFIDQQFFGPSYWGNRFSRDFINTRIIFSKKEVDVDVDKGTAVDSKKKA